MAGATSTTSVPDYHAIYRNVNQVTRAVASTQCSEVMSIHRMYFKLDMLAVELLRDVDKVKQLVVFADVVEIEGDKVELPAASKVTIVCRILLVKKEDVQLEFKFLGPVECESLKLSGPSWGADSGWGPAHIVRSSPQVQLSMYTQQAVCTRASARLRVRHPVRVTERELFTPMSSRLQNIFRAAMEWRIGIASSHDGNLSTAERSHELGADDVSAKTWNINLTEWSRFISLLQPVASRIPLSSMADPNVILGMQSTLLIAELILSYQTHQPETVSAAVQHVQWLSESLLQVVADNNSGQLLGRGETTQELLTLLARSQSLLKLPVDGSQNLIVPRLEYGQYRNLISNMATVAEAYNNEFRQVDLFIQQNEILGSYLLQQNKAFAQREKDMEAFYGLVVARKQEELRAAQERMKELDAQLTQQREAMDEAKEKMDQGLQEYRDRQVANAFFAVLRGVLEIGAAIFTGGATAGAAVRGASEAVNAVSQLAGLLDTVLKIMEGMEKVMEVLNAINDLTTSISEINQMVDAPQMPSMPSTMEWDIFENEMEEVAESMPTEVTEARTWKTKCRNVAAVCREISTTAAYIGQLQYDLFVNSSQEEIAKKHAERLEAIQPADLNNYLEMATQLDMRTSRMLIGLLKVLTLQNGALLFHFLLPPKPFTGWVTMDMVRNALVQHEADALAARERLGPSTDFTRTYVVSGIPLSLLLDGDDWIFTIPVDDDSTFPLSWSRVRIRYLEMKFSGGEEFHKPTTNSGQVYILLQAARIFHDRLLGEVLHYEAAVPLRYQYAYALESGETTLSNRPSQQHDGEYMQMTPFCQWRLRLSASAFENQGLAFPTAAPAQFNSSTTQISITFYLTAIRRIDTRHELSE